MGAQPTTNANPHGISAYRAWLNYHYHVVDTGHETSTSTSYNAAWDRFAQSHSHVDAEKAARWLLGMSKGEAFGVVSAWQTALADEGLSPATINSYCAALRSFTVFLYKRGMLDWELGVERMRLPPKRPRSGPGKDVVARLLMKRDDTPIAARDYAMMRLMADCGLRVTEVTERNIADYDGDILRVRRLKQRAKGELWDDIPLMPKTKQAVDFWLMMRGGPYGQKQPLFLSMRGSVRLTRNAVEEAFRRHCKKIRLRDEEDTPIVVMPHQLKHYFATTAFQAAADLGIDLMQVKSATRHKNLPTAELYFHYSEDVRRRLLAQVDRANP